MKLKLLTCLAAGFMVATSAFAQYKEQRFPQKAEEVANLKKNKVKTRTQFELKNGAEVPQTVVQFDKEGRIISAVKDGHKKFYTYDATGRMKTMVDSAAGRRPARGVYHFTYDPGNGYLAEVSGPGGRSVFYFNEGRYILEELYKTVLDEDLPRFYKYDDKGNVLEEKFHLNTGEVHNLHKYFFREGKLVSETIATFNNDNSHDTIGIIYTYNAKGQLISKQKNEIHVLIRFEDETREEIREQQQVTYTYDAKGNLIKEEAKGTKSNENYTLEWTYDAMGLPVKEVKYDIQRQPVYTYIYKYKQY